jgi:hypothetical protein
MLRRDANLANLLTFHEKCDQNLNNIYYNPSPNIRFYCCCALKSCAGAFFEGWL